MSQVHHKSDEVKPDLAINRRDRRLCGWPEFRLTAAYVSAENRVEGITFRQCSSRRCLKSQFTNLAKNCQSGTVAFAESDLN